MPVQALKIQANGSERGWSSLTGGVFGFDTVDDSDAVSHDAATSYLTLPQSKRVSFPVFLQAEGIRPQSLTVNVVAQRGGASHPLMRIGFLRGSQLGFDAVLFDPPATWTLAQRTFATNPITLAAWTVDDLLGLELCIENDSTVGTNDVTLMSGSVTYSPLTNWQWPSISV